MKSYPTISQSVKLYEANDYQLRDLARESVKVAEPQKVKLAFKIAIAISAISIVGLPIAFALETYRNEKRDAKEAKVFDKLKRLRDAQVTHNLKEPIRVQWAGNASPDIGLNGDTALVWKALKKHPECLRFNIDDLRAGGHGVPGLPRQVPIVAAKDAQA